MKSHKLSNEAPDWASHLVGAAIKDFARALPLGAFQKYTGIKMKGRKTRTVRIRDYGDDWVNRLALVCDQFDQMQIEEATAALRFIVSKYNLQTAFAVIAQETRE